MFNRPEKKFEREFYKKLDPFPILSTPRLTLRHLFREDTDDLFEGTSDPRVTRYEPWGPYDRTETETMVENALKQMEEGLSVEWAMECDGKVIGLIHLNDVDFFQRSGEIGYWISRAFWNRGLMTEALRALTEFCIFSLELDSVTALVHCENAASMRVLEKCGYRKRETVRNLLELHGKPADGYEYEITRWTLLGQR